MDNIVYLFLLFIIYSFLGWICEVIVGVIQHKRLINRGFLIGPLCPIYGVGSLFILLVLGKYNNDPITLFLLSVIICSILEYFTSYIMEKIFKNRWWDYSDMKFNINGRICLEFACAFGVGGLAVTFITNPFILDVLNMINSKVLNIISIILAFIFIIDCIVSFKIIFKLKQISSSIKSDSTEIITKKVRDIIKSKSLLLKRLADSFPDMKIYNKLTILKQRIEIDKIRLKKEKRNKKRRL